jgi:hypothetical protein
MDAGLAAVCGAFAGALATTGAAWITGWTTRETARISARSQHKKERREPRQAHYRAFLVASYPVRDLLSKTRSHSAEFPVVNNEFSGELQSAAEQLKGLRLDVTLYGPENVSACARQLEQVASIAVREARVYVVMGMLDTATLSISDHEDRNKALLTVQEAFSHFENSMSQFERSAQIALDDDGSK